MAVMPKTKPKFMMLGKSKFVHVVTTEHGDLKAKREGGGVGSPCQQVRKYAVAGKINYKSKGLSAEAAMALDGCEACATLPTAQSMVSPESKREAAKDKRDDVLARAKCSTAKSKSKAAKSERPKAEPKPKKASMTKSGPRSTASRADGDPTKVKAQMLADYAIEHDWKAIIGEDTGTGHTVVTATKGDAVIDAWFIDGKYDINRHAEIRVGSWVGKLRGAHACRRQMEGSNPIHPEPGKGRTGPRRKDVEPDVPEDESPEDARKRVPFSIDDDDIVIIDAIKGRVIKWRNGTTNSIEEAWVPGQVMKPGAKKGKGRPCISIVAHPKTGKRMVSFFTVTGIGDHGEIYGPERNVYLDKIVRVVE